jgi:hypothetical protein
MKTSFREEQRFNQLWMRLGLVAVTASVFITDLWRYEYGYLYENVILWSVKVMVVGLAVFVAFAFKIESEVDQFGIKLNCWPVADKNIKWNDIESAEVIKYGFVGGWGIRLWTKFGTVYNTGGKIGLQVKLKSGKKFLIGTRKPEELKSFMNQLVKR